MYPNSSNASSTQDLTPPEKNLKLQFEYENAYCMRENASPVFLRCQGVKGSLKVDNGSSRNIDKVKIVLKGTMMNVLQHHTNCSTSLEPHRLLAAETILNLVEAHDWPSSDSLTEAEVKSAAFSFDFPLYRKPWESQQDFTSSMGMLPSTLSVTGYGCRAPTGGFSCSATSQIRYEVQAFAYDDKDELVDCTIATVALFDTENPSPPPIHQEHFKGEYACTKEKRLRRFGFRGASLSISASEPQPIEIQPKTGLAMAAVPLRLTLRTKKKSSLSPEDMPLNIKIISMLKASTYLSVAKMKAHPTISSSQESPFLAALCKFSGKRIRNLQVDGWEQENPKDPRTWVKDITVLLPVAESSFPSPSFFTPFVARRYSMSLRVEIKSSLGDSVYRLAVPIQIVYPETPVHYDNIYSPELTEEHPSGPSSPLDEVPIYIR
ncbi:hypothetical protein BT63DRAFT_34033 [Microthyrium microscopicum]|uniref:Arrestin-like N-terminal domain-containing protein n=1 Tax=Microthyrium microscopicum TaxID=703497 RepID=A0A6A6UW57_9PEZI|nr:hypothetical protein BT63DRAFT_34033 [Microthyrium microscopicum]